MTPTTDLSTVLASGERITLSPRATVDGAHEVQLGAYACMALAISLTHDPDRRLP